MEYLTRFHYKHLRYQTTGLYSSTTEIKAVNTRKNTTGSLRILRNQLHRFAARRVAAAAVILIVAVLGGYLLISSHAASSTVSLEPESGVITGPACKATDATASAGGYVNLGGCPQVTLTAQQLAQAILANPHISFQVPQERTDFTQIAQTGREQSDCGGTVAISPALLQVLLTASQKYTIVIGVLAYRHGCDSGFHPKGMAADLNGVNALDGSVGTGNYLHFDVLTSAQLALVRQFYGDVGNLLIAINQGGGLGQQQCFVGAAPPKVTGVVYFDDVCNHLHIDVGKR